MAVMLKEAVAPRGSGFSAASLRGLWREPYLSRALREDIASLLYRFLWAPLTGFVLLAQVGISVTTGIREPTRYVPGAIWCLALLLGTALRKRRGALFSVSVVVWGFVAATSFAVVTHSVHAPAYWSNILALAVVLPLYGVRAGVGLALFSAFCGALWFALPVFGYHSVLVYPASSFAYLFLVGSMFAGIGVMTIPTALLAVALKSSEARRLEVLAARTAEKNAELAFQQIFEQTGTISILVSNDGTITRVNPAAERLLGVEPQSLIGEAISSLPWVDSDARATWAAVLARAGVGSERVNAVLSSAEGQRHLQLSVGPILRTDGTVESRAIAGLDVTRLLEASRNLAHARRLESLGQLAGGVAHDFNNMLHAIAGALEPLKSPKPSSREFSDCFETIDQAVLRASDLTRKLLAFGRRDRFETQLLEPDLILPEIGAVLSRALGNEYTLKFELQAEGVGIDGDRAAIEHALLNLVANSKEALSRAGGLVPLGEPHVTVSTRVFTADEAWCAQQDFPASPGNLLVLSVRDRGCGMTESVRSRVFEPFFTTKPMGDASGLGLAAVHGTLLSHGGGVGVESEPEHGTTIHLYFPVASSRPLAKHPSSGIGFVPQLRGTVLVVDDEPLVLRVTRRYLKALGADVLLVSDGEAALELLDGGAQVHCVLTDIVMPKMSGGTLITRLRASYPKLPVVVMSGFPAEGGGLLQEVPTGCPWIRKPFRQAELARVLAPFVDGRSLEESASDSS